MSTKINLSIEDMLKRFESVGNNMLGTIYVALLVSAERMIRDVVTERMSGPRGAPGHLGVVTGGGRRSMRYRVTYSKERFRVVLGTLLGYIDVHEQGYHGTQHVRAHERRRLGAIQAVSIAQATRGLVDKRRRATKRQREAGPIQVRAHDRMANIQAKHFMRDTVRASSVPTENRIVRALEIAMLTGRVPTASQVGG
jgi:hypothetical protein